MKTAEEIFAMTKQFYAPQAIAQLDEWKCEIQQDSRYQALSEAAETARLSVTHTNDCGLTITGKPCNCSCDGVGGLLSEAAIHQAQKKGSE